MIVCDELLTEILSENTDLPQKMIVLSDMRQIFVIDRFFWEIWYCCMREAGDWKFSKRGFLVRDPQKFIHFLRDFFIYGLHHRLDFSSLIFGFKACWIKRLGNLLVFYNFVLLNCFSFPALTSRKTRSSKNKFARNAKTNFTFRCRGWKLLREISRI